MHRAPILVSLFILACGTRVIGAQEPAFISGIQAIRFEENPGYFHYIIPCKTAAEFQPQMIAANPHAAGLEPAICWPVKALRMLKVNGKFESSQPEDGQIVVSAHNLRFNPHDPKLADHYVDLRPADVRFEHQAGKNYAFFGSNDVFYKFFFAILCSACTPGTPAPTDSNQAQLETEYALVGDSIKQFDTVLKRVHDLSSEIRIEILPANQPTSGDPPEAMGLYGSLNDRLVPLCSEPAQACIRSYARYQACKGASPDADCGPQPSCSATCALGEDNTRALNAAFCVQNDQQSATPLPDWTDVLRKKNGAPPPPPDPGSPGIQYAGPMIRPFRAGALDLQLAPGPNPPSAVGCSVKASYVRATTPQFAVAAMKPMPMAPSGGVIGSVFGNAIPRQAGNISAPKKIVIPSSLATSMLIQQVRPIYPPIAKAARLSGAVILQATISKAGYVENLRVVSGNAMLQQAALDAVRQWQYKPYLLNGEPVEVDTTVNVIFNLDLPPAAAPAPAQP